MSVANDGRPLTDLLSGLVSDMTSLFRKEVQLAKTEASEKVSQALTALASIAAGGVLVLGALGVLLSAIVQLLAAWMVGMNLNPTLASALSALIVTLVVGIAGWIAVNRGLAALKASNLNLNRTTASLGRDAEAVKERL
ncbi:phage holin family protein [Devosia salina]|uniref:Phage holin family protein n=1 Tax=Devosia salina TaxID=2860336 RepID=A0ABX8WD32_9HYPH|nr:phage holin family protein [Devosia salina]QYO76065.1 phage holin family protein [Devosia salina]